jgi:sugar O-acyltransferase (sialic acid O-acetyltransferase NeuD family)
MSEQQRPVVIFGTGDIGQLAHFYFTKDLGREIVAFTGDADRLDRATFCGLPVVPFEGVAEAYPPGDFEMFVALSYSRLNQVRARKYQEAKARGYVLTNLICSRLVSWGDTEIGDNCFIFENQTIQPFVRIGNNVTLWSGNHIGHHSTIGDHCFLTSHVVISGHVTVGPFCFFGVNSAIRDGLTIAEGTVVGAGAMVVKDTVPNGVYMGKAAELKSQDSASLNYFVNTAYAPPADTKS